MNTTKFSVWAVAFVFVLALLATGCKTGKGCDCPTFGKNETPKMTRF